MFEFQGFLTSLFAGLSISLLGTIAYFLYRLPQTLKDLQNFMRSMNHRMEIAERRIDVHDALWGTYFKTSINSSMIAKGDVDLEDVFVRVQRMKDQDK